MGFEERNAWVFAGVTPLVAGYYLLQVLGGDPAVPLEARPYQEAMLWSIGGGIVVTIVLSIAVNIVAGMLTGDTNTRADLRDRQIERFGGHVGHGFVVLGAVGGLILALLGIDQFWIAQALYFGLMLSGLLGSIARIAAYRFGFAPW